MTTTLRLTKRGRFVVAALIAIPVISLSILLATPGALAGSDEVGNDFDYVTVLSGDTLWGIAREFAPNEDPREVVAAIMALNQLSSAALQPGQELAIPR